MHSRYPEMSRIFKALCKAVNSPVSLKAWLLFCNHEHVQLSEMRVDPSNYTSAVTFRKDYLITSYLRKWVGLETGIDLERVAFQKFETSEILCKNSNLRLLESRRGISKCPVSGIIYRAQRKIASLLGPFSMFKCEEYGWGPGATHELSRARAFPDTKLSEVPISVTAKALNVSRDTISRDLHWSAVVLNISPCDLLGDFCFLPSIFSVVGGCRMAFVPKDSTTHRTIAIEPRMNSFLQKGVGSYFRKMLKRVGINLDDQEPNQIGAFRAYSEKLATLDLKAASDSVSRELGSELLPVEWAMYLDDIRSHVFSLDGEEIRLHKFSSMGNGFTFELESLIFWGLAASVVDDIEPGGDILVYGDDIILPRSCASKLVEVLEWCGFVINLDKSYTSGNFFESCGKHYFEGQDVTPIYQKELIVDLRSSIRAFNRLTRYAEKYSRDGRMSHLTRAACKTFPAFDAGAPFIPLGTEGDDGYLLTGDEFPITTQNPNFGLACKVVRPDMNRFPAHESALLALTLRFGCETLTPYLGTLGREGSFVSYSSRWVMPTGTFGSLR